MASLPSPVRGRKPSRKPLEPVSVTGCFCDGVTPDQLATGGAILQIADAKDETLYWCDGVFNDGRLVGVKLQKFGQTAAEAEAHHVYLAGPVCCDCEDATYRPDRPGGCRHVVALNQALPELARRASPPSLPTVAA